MKNTYELNDRLYKRLIILYIGSSKQCFRHFDKKWDILLEPRVMEAQGACYDIVERSIVIVWLPKWKFTRKNVIVLTHELLHAAEFTLTNVGVTDHREALAYLHSFYLGEFLSKLK